MCFYQRNTSETHLRFSIIAAAQLQQLLFPHSSPHGPPGPVIRNSLPVQLKFLCLNLLLVEMFAKRLKSSDLSEILMCIALMFRHVGEIWSWVDATALMGYVVLWVSDRVTIQKDSKLNGSFYDGNSTVSCIAFNSLRHSNHLVTSLVTALAVQRLTTVTSKGTKLRAAQVNNQKNWTPLLRWHVSRT